MFESCLFLALVIRFAAPTSSPNIIMILADDLGWNDISFHGSNQFLTPNIDALAYSGVILHNYYTQPICTPARAALLTGRHPINNGMEHNVIYAPQPWGLSLKERLLPQYLQDLGYESHAVGKWHLGFYKAAYTPTKRGFQSHYGNWLGHQNHFTHYAFERNRGYDLRRGLNISWEGQGRYTVDLYTEEAEKIIRAHNTIRPLFLYLSHTVPHAPVLAPDEDVLKLKHIPKGKRRIYAAMVSKLDESVGRVTQALRQNGMLNNSIIVFVTDNGGSALGYNGNVASNFPLKGGKDTLWEGGIRGVGFIWSPRLKQTPRVHHGFVNVQDWLPTLLSAISDNHGFDLSNLDGKSQWGALNLDSPSPYNTMLHNIDPIRKIAALRHGKWKIIIGQTHSGRYDGWSNYIPTELPYNLGAIRNSSAGKSIHGTSSHLPDDKTILRLREEVTINDLRHYESSTPTYTSSPKTPKLEHHLKIKGESIILTRTCKPKKAPCLYNLEEDPCELYNIAVDHPRVVAQLLHLLGQYHLTKPHNRQRDPFSNPNYWNHTWVPWKDVDPLMPQ